MQYGVLGRTGVRVSRICVGTATFGVAPVEGEAIPLIHRALDLGINFFDTANSYGNQTRFDRPGVPPAPQRKWAEELLGEALKGHRHDVILASKVMEQVGPGVNDGGWSGAAYRAVTSCNRWSTACGGCRPITWTSTMRTTPTLSPRSTIPCARSRT